MRSSVLIAAALALTSGCALQPSTGDGSSATTSTEYVDILDYAGVDQGAFYDLRSKLDDAFASQRGLTSLGLSCSVTSKLGKVHDCVWTFVGSDEAVDSRTAAIAVDAPFYQCHLGTSTTGPKLVSILSTASDPLSVTLPGASQSIQSTLDACFQHPIGDTPISVATDGTTYVEAGDFYTSASYRARWDAAKAALVNGYEDVCGDTFCDGDYGHIRSLAFVCAVTRSSGNVKECAWIFGGAYAMPSAKGAEVVDEKTWRCEVPVKGTLSQLTSVLTSTTVQDDVLHRPLPGTTATAYDALLNCSL